MFAYAQILSDYGMWPVLRVKRGRQVSKRSHNTALHAYPLLFGGGGGGGGTLSSRYDMVCSGYRGIFVIWSYTRLL